MLVHKLWGSLELTLRYIYLSPPEPAASARLLFFFDVNVNFDGGLSSQAIKAELKLHLRALLAAGCGVDVCVWRAGITRGYHGLKWLKCQDFTAPRSTLSVLILAAGEME